MRALPLALLALLAACGRMGEIGRPPEMSPIAGSPEEYAMLVPGLPATAPTPIPLQEASLWGGGPGSLLGDRRALQRGDILTVVIEIDESAEMQQTSRRSRSGAESLGMPSLFGIPQRLDPSLPEGASLADAVSVKSSGSARGDGNVRRAEKLELRVAAVVTDVMPNGALAIRGSQEVRVNFEMRELLVTGFVRPGDISRLNEITYDKIASARIAYGGRGQITDMQQPRWGQQAADALLPF